MTTPRICHEAISDTAQFSEKSLRVKNTDYKVHIIDNCLPIEDTNEFIQWCKGKGHHITIWCERPNHLAVKVATETWLEMNQVPYDRLLFDRPKEAVFVDDTPPNAKYFAGWGDNEIVAAMFEEWKKWITEKDKKDHLEK